jgi:hypothetical protein
MLSNYPKYQIKIKMKKIFLLLIPFLATCLYSGAQENEYWLLKDGCVGQYLMQLDTDTFVLVANEFAYVEEEGVSRPSVLNMHYFNTDGFFLYSNSINFSNHQNVLLVEPIRAVYYHDQISSRHMVFRLSNGNFLIGGHGLYNHDNNKKLSDKTSSYTDNNPQKKIEYFQPTLDENNKDDFLMINPMIFTLNPSFDSILKMDTLEAVPYYGAVVLIKEIAPDTLLIGYHKRNESRHDLLETDSLFNVRWKTEFGQIDGYVADIYDFETTTDGDYLISMHYISMWQPHVFGLRKNKLLKFSRSGDILWEKWISRPNNITTMFTITAIEDDQFLIVYDDCCIMPPGNHFDQILLHDETGIYLRVIDSDGNTLQEKSLVDFLSAYVTTYDGIQPPGSTVEDPEAAYPWFFPLQTIKNPDNTYLISGMHYPTAWPLYYARGFLLKVDEDLNPVWIRIFDIDKKNYPYGGNRVSLRDIKQVSKTEEDNHINDTVSKIFVTGTFEATQFNTYTSPYYPPIYFGSYFWKGILIPLDGYGCHEPGCHLTIGENTIPVLEIEIVLYPNPAKEVLHVRIDVPRIEEKTKVIFIHDISGTGIINEKFTKNEHTVSLKNFPAGIYTAFIMCEGQILKTEKIVVVK